MIRQERDEWPETHEEEPPRDHPDDHVRVSPAVPIHGAPHRADPVEEEQEAKEAHVPDDHQGGKVDDQGVHHIERIR